jgi:hypothetical protein
MNALLSRFALIATILIAPLCSSALIQAERPDTTSPYIADDLRELVETTAVSGYEQAVRRRLLLLLAAQANHRIDTRGAARGNIAGNKGNDCEQNCNAGKGERIS